MTKKTTTVYLFGAGASRGYYRSVTGVHPPLATNYFSTFSNLAISGDFLVKIGFIVNYIRDTRGIPPERQPIDFDESIELVFAELDDKLNLVFESSLRTSPDIDKFVEQVSLGKTYDQFIFWFSQVLNEVQNGDVCTIYSKLIERVTPEDLLITFNWDTILDRALYQSGRWFPDDGYGVDFDGILNKKWGIPNKKQSEISLLKLHGSTNWFGGYITRDLRDGERRWFSAPENLYKVWCLVDGSEHFSSYKDRWRPDYRPFSYFFPPNDPVSDMPLMPIIIPPTERKIFSEYRDIFYPLWDEANNRLKEAQKLVVVGYSFPATDEHAFDLVDSFVGNGNGKTIEVIDPYPKGVIDRIRNHASGGYDLIVHESTLSQYLGLQDVVLGKQDSELEKIKATEQLDMAMKVTDEDHRTDFLIAMLMNCNINNGFLDLSTFDGRRFLDVKVEGEFATLMISASKPSVIEYRLDNIPFRQADNSIISLSINNIWIVTPTGSEPLSDEKLAQVDMTKVPQSTIEMIKNGFHCKNDNELEYFVRRFIAA